LGTSGLSLRTARVPTTADWLVLLAGFFAAVMNSVAGGGTMLTFPALLAAGLPPVLANTTSTVALYFGMPGSLWAFRKRLAEVKAWILPLGIVSLLGGFAGAWLLLRFDESVFERIVPWLLLFATLLFLLNGPIRRWLRKHETEEPDRPKTWGIFFQSGVAIYGGYFGAGIGIMMLAGLGVLGLRDVNRMNALKALLGLLCNTSAVVLFMIKGAVDWRLAGFLLAGSIPGYFFGSHFAQRIPAVAVRAIVAIIGISIAAHLFWKQLNP
ncbi:sulfite exporter TauE/SafE family protein, partial [Haloferula sp.]|uniref:sulfite exporter TauE/SafE family protein n=1 Tax=Haloferula sp. TaxID=2497595 RepID=UPI003C78C854